MFKIRKFVKNSNDKRKMFVNLQNFYRTMIVDFTFATYSQLVIEIVDNNRIMKGIG